MPRAANGQFTRARDFGGLPDVMLVNRTVSNVVNNLTENARSLPSELSGFNGPDRRRNLNDECGYPDTAHLTAAHYRNYYDRHPIGRRVVEILPIETWKAQPTVFESEDVNQETEFERGWKELVQGIRGNSKYADEEGNPIWEYLQRLDIVSGIGHFGVLLIGFDDVNGSDITLKTEVQAGDRNVLFLRVFDESMVEVTQWESDPTSPRYGFPNEYSINFADPNHPTSGISVPNQTFDVHWSRIIHVADNLDSSEVIGTPRMQPVYDRLYDLQKYYSGGAEGYWKGSFPGISWETHPQLGPDVRLNKSAMKAQLEQYDNSLQRHLFSKGLHANPLLPQVVDPSKQIESQIDAICIVQGIPKRKFVGSERGELASSQDSEDWNDRLLGRQNSLCTPRIIVPFIDRLILFGALPDPAEYHVSWPGLDSTSQQEKADIALKKTQALAAYVSGDGVAVITPQDYLTKFQGFEEDEALSMVETAMGELDDSPLFKPEEPDAQDQQNEGPPNT